MSELVVRQHPREDLVRQGLNDPVWTPLALELDDRGPAFLDGNGERRDFPPQAAVLYLLTRPEGIASKCFFLVVTDPSRHVLLRTESVGDDLWDHEELTEFARRAGLEFTAAEYLDTGQFAKDFHGEREFKHAPEVRVMPSGRGCLPTTAAVLATALLALRR
jgi:hypothetical protein